MNAGTLMALESVQKGQTGLNNFRNLRGDSQVKCQAPWNYASSTRNVTTWIVKHLQGYKFQQVAYTMKDTPRPQNQL